MNDNVTTSPKRRYKRLTASQWTEITALWEGGETTLQELSDQFGATPRALQHHFRRNRITKGSRAAAMAAAVRERIEEEHIDDRDRLVARAREIRERAYRNATIVENLVMSQLALAESEPSQVNRIGSALKALSLASASLERLHDLKQKALGLDKDAALPQDLPVLEVRELTAEDIERLRTDQRAAGDELDDDLVEDKNLDENEVYDVIVEELTADAEGGTPHQALPSGSRLVRGAI